MDKQLYELALAKAEDEQFKQVLSLLLARVPLYEQLKAENSRLFCENRARREEITVEQIERDAERVAAKYALSPAEIEKTSAARTARVMSAQSDSWLFSMLRRSELNAMKHAAHWAKWSARKQPENAPIHRREIEFLGENLRLLYDLGLQKSWPPPSNLESLLD